MRLKILLIVLAACYVAAAQTSTTESNVPRPGVKEVQVPFASLKPSATIKIGGTADWVLIVGSEEARLRASLRPPPKLHVRFSRMQLSRRYVT